MAKLKETIDKDYKRPDNIAIGLSTPATCSIFLAAAAGRRPISIELKDEPIRRPDAPPRRRKPIRYR